MEKTARFKFPIFVMMKKMDAKSDSFRDDNGFVFTARDTDDAQIMLMYFNKKGGLIDNTTTKPYAFIEIKGSSHLDLFRELYPNSIGVAYDLIYPENADCKYSTVVFENAVFDQ